MEVSTSAFADVPEKRAEAKRVCIKVYDAKQKKDVEKCKKLKIHEKHDGKLKLQKILPNLV